MPRRNDPHARASGFDDLHDRLPRSIALRLARAGFTPSTLSTRTTEPARADDDGERRDDPTGARARVVER